MPSLLSINLREVQPRMVPLKMSISKRPPTRMSRFFHSGMGDMLLLLRWSLDAHYYLLVLYLLLAARQTTSKLGCTERGREVFTKLKQAV